MSKDATHYRRATEEEMASLCKNRTWKLVDRQPHHKLVKCKWMYKLKIPIKQDDKPIYKARLVTKGFNQKEDIDYNELFSHVVKNTFIRIMVPIVARKYLELQKMDVKATFLHENLDEVIHMEQLEGI